MKALSPETAAKEFGGISKPDFFDHAPTRWLTVCGLVLVAAIAIGTALTIVRFRETAIETGKQGLESAVLLLARHFDQQFDDFSIPQKDIVTELESREISSPGDFKAEIGTLAAHELLRARVGSWNDVAGVNVFDADGVLINSSKTWPVPDIKIADRDYFKALRVGSADDTEVQVVAGRFSQAHAVVFARRISGPHGEFLGVLARAISPAILESFFASAGLGPDATISMHHRDGVLLARYPHVETMIGQNFKAGPAQQRAVFETPRLTGRLDSPVDGKDRLVASRTLASGPFVIVATRTVDSTLATWRSQTRFFVGMAALSLSVTTLMLYLIFRQMMRHHQAAQRQLSVEKLRLDTAIGHMSQGLLLFDSSERLIVCNGRYIEMYGLSPEIVKPGCKFLDLLRHRQETGSFNGDVDRYYNQMLRTNGSSNIKIVVTSDDRSIQIRNEPVPGGGWLATHEDVTDRRRAEARIAHLAHFDTLTNLPNRVLFREHVDKKFSRLSPAERFAILYVDIDEFKSVNDSLGHHVGDELLKCVASRLVGCAGPNDLVARLGGDEFAIVKADVSDQSGLLRFVEEIYVELRRPSDCLGHEITMDASIGIAIAPDNGFNLDDLLKNADLAMYDAKSSGRRTHRFFAPEMGTRMEARRLLELDLRRAIAEGAFEVYYQPLVDLVSNAVTGCEALLRWNHVERGMVSPAEFIPLAEETGLIVELGEWVLSKACADAVSWPDHVTLAVNVSPVQFKSNTLALKVTSALAKSGLSPRRLELEITEAVLIRDDEQALETLHQLKQIGVRISLDDFGTGYSSLSYLQRFPFDKIKIDRSFVENLCDAEGSAPIVQAVVNMALARGMSTTAEGVETEAQRRILRELGCTQLQGFLFSPAIPEKRIKELLLGHASGRIFA